jgi:hypothetical protein
MVWLDRIFGDTSPLFSASFVSRHFVRIIVVFVALFAAFSAKPENGGPDQFHGLLNATSAAETLARWMQPSTAAAATRKRQRAASTRAQENKTEVASETSPEPSASVLAPLTPFIQIWPQVLLYYFSSQHIRYLSYQCLDHLYISSTCHKHLTGGRHFNKFRVSF